MTCISGKVGGTVCDYIEDETYGYTKKREEILNLPAEIFAQRQKWKESLKDVSYEEDVTKR